MTLSTCSVCVWFLCFLRDEIGHLLNIVKTGCTMLPSLEDQTQEELANHMLLDKHEGFWLFVHISIG